MPPTFCTANASESTATANALQPRESRRDVAVITAAGRIEVRSGRRVGLREVLPQPDGCRCDEALTTQSPDHLLDRDFALGRADRRFEKRLLACSGGAASGKLRTRFEASQK